ncbi:hypothetical protein [Streptomyces virginiae]|uniref:hypothetical protein n=1 Tax=Streptomyces virginiae TaxID=1961 RepID=UPI0030E2E585
MAKIDPVARAREMSARGVDLLVPYPGADKRWPGICRTCKAETKSSYSSVISKGQGVCWKCSQRASSRAAAEKRAIPHVVAAAKIRAAGAEPLEPFPGTATTWRCRCKFCSREIDVWYTSVVHAGNGPCEYCSGSMRIPDAEAHAKMILLGLEPLVPYPGANAPWLSRCATCKKISDPTLNNARKTKHDCRYCAKRATDSDTAMQIMAEAGLTPLTPFPGTVKAPWPAIHNACEKRVANTLDKVIQRRRAACSNCARYGFNPELRGILYLMVHPGLGAAKIGICNQQSGRISEHKRHGWLPVIQRDLNGHDVILAEDHVLARWLSLELPHGVRRADMPQGGWTETVALIDRNMELLVGDFHEAVNSVPPKNQVFLKEDDEDRQSVLG